MYICYLFISKACVSDRASMCIPKKCKSGIVCTMRTLTCSTLEKSVCYHWAALIPACWPCSVVRGSAFFHVKRIQNHVSRSLCQIRWNSVLLNSVVQGRRVPVSVEMVSCRRRPFGPFRQPSRKHTTTLLAPLTERTEYCSSHTTQAPSFDGNKERIWYLVYGEKGLTQLVPAWDTHSTDVYARSSTCPPSYSRSESPPRSCPSWFVWVLRKVFVVLENVQWDTCEGCRAVQARKGLTTCQYNTVFIDIKADHVYKWCRSGIRTPEPSNYAALS